MQNRRYNILEERKCKDKSEEIEYYIRSGIEYEICIEKETFYIYFNFLT